MKLDAKKSKAAVKDSTVKQTKGQGKEKVKYKIDTYSCFYCRLCKCYFKWFIS